MWGRAPLASPCLHPPHDSPACACASVLHLLLLLARSHIRHAAAEAGARPPPMPEAWAHACPSPVAGLPRKGSELHRLWGKAGAAPPTCPCPHQVSLGHGGVHQDGGSQGSSGEAGGGLVVGGGNHHGAAGGALVAGSAHLELLAAVRGRVGRVRGLLERLSMPARQKLPPLAPAHPARVEAIILACAVGVSVRMREWTDERARWERWDGRFLAMSCRSWLSMIPGFGPIKPRGWRTNAQMYQSCR